MRKLTIYHLKLCPYCKSAKRAVEKLQSENPEYAKVEIEWIDENTVNTFPEWCDYYYVPTIYLGEKKLYEAKPGDSFEVILHKVEEAFKEVLAYKTSE